MNKYKKLDDLAMVCHMSDLLMFNGVKLLFNDAQLCIYVYGCVYMYVYMHSWSSLNQNLTALNINR
jgi:hypothetical protein